MAVLSCRHCEETKINGALFIDHHDFTCVCGDCAQKAIRDLVDKNKELTEALTKARDSLVLSKAVDQSDDIMIPLIILEKVLEVEEVEAVEEEV